jgi:ferredoxin-NADP reductase
MAEPRLPSLLVAHHRPGFYLRVITEGRIAAGDEIVRTRVGPHTLSVAEIDALLYLPDRDPARLQDAVDVPALSPGWRGSFEDLLAGAAGAPPLGAEPRPAAWAGFRTLQVRAVTAESTGIGSIYLDSADGQPLPPPRAGQFLALRIPGAGDPAPVRSYSLSGDPAAAGYRISVKRETHGLVSTYLHSHLRPGARIEVAAPRGDFVLDSGTNPVALVSAGVGVTPVLAMLHQLATQRTARQVWWVHTTHDASTHAFAVEAGDLLGSLADVRAFVFYTAPSEPPPSDSGISVGRLTAEVIASLQVPSEASAFVCGPEQFMDDVVAALQVAGLAPARLHTERFGARAPINPGVVGETPRAPHPPAGPRGSGPLVTFARSGLSTEWSDDFASVLELAEACDVPTQWSCRTGVCHTCMTAVLSGGTRYVTPPLEEPASGEVLICSAQPTTDLVIDL